MKGRWLERLCLGAVLLWGPGAFSLEHVFAFKEASQVKSWRIASQIMEPLELSPRFGVFGGRSLRFASPQWGGGSMPQWPACESKPERRDWSGFDRLVIDLTNTGKASQHLSFFATDSKIALRKGMSGSCPLEGMSTKRFVFKLSRCPKTVNLKDMSLVHLFTQRPGTDMEVFVGSMFLLRPGEAMPEYPAAFMTQIRDMYKPMLDESQAMVHKTMENLRAYEQEPRLKTYLDTICGTFNRLFGGQVKLFEKASLTMEELQSVRRFAGEMQNRCECLEDDMVFLREALQSGQDISRMAIGVASTMEKIMPCDVGSKPDVARSLDLSLARNEWEGIQVVVKATAGNLQGVTVELSSLKNEAGVELERAEVDVVGYVKTERHPPYEVKHVGWWPDPLLRGRRSGAEGRLDSCGAVPVALGNQQSFWLRFRGGKTQAAGVYRGTATVRASGVKPVSLPVSVRVYPFCLPDHTALPTAITLNLPVKQMSQKIPFDKMKYVYADFMADYQIDYDHLYRGGEPDWDVLTYLHKQGRLTAFNFGYMDVNYKNFKADMAKRIKRFKVSYDKAKKLGLLDYAYIYGFDECHKDRFPALERCCAELRKAFPEVMLMTTTYDHSYGLNSEVKSLQAWCPQTPMYDPVQAEKSRASGRWVWWYIACTPHNPYANWFIEYAAIETRLLLGAQAVKYRPDGFLYYCTAIWNENMGIDCAKGPFTTWNPVSWTIYHGDGSLFYCDKDGYPMPSIRLENYRDGMEDYAYARILEEAIRRVKAKQTLSEADKAWLKDAEAALQVPESLVKSLTEYSRDPKQVRIWRRRMAEAIVKSGMEDLNPWPKVFGARGWRTPQK